MRDPQSAKIVRHSPDTSSWPPALLSEFLSHRQGCRLFLAEQRAEVYELRVKRQRWLVAHAKYDAVQKVLADLEQRNRTWLIQHGEVQAPEGRSEETLSKMLRKLDDE